MHPPRLRDTPAKASSKGVSPPRSRTEPKMMGNKGLAKRGASVPKVGGGKEPPWGKGSGVGR